MFVACIQHIEQQWYTTLQKYRKSNWYADICVCSGNKHLWSILQSHRRLYKVIT